MLAIFVIKDVLHQFVVDVQNQRLVTTEHGWIHAVHIVHLHHILHTAGLLRYSQHGGNALVFQLLDLNLKLIIAKSLLEGLSQSLGGLLEFLIVILDLFLEGAV